MIGRNYLSKLGRNINGKLKKIVTPLLKDGIGDKMDKGNLWIVPGFTILAFAVLWCAKLSKLALEESTCRGISPYHPPGSLLDDEAQRHCQTAKRYFVGINEPFSYEPSWREARQVKNPEWVLYFFLPIVFVMYVLARYLWSLLMENQGINFNNVVNASQSVMMDNDGVSEVDEQKLGERIFVIAANFRCASSSNAFAAFIAFEFILVLAPLLLLIVILPLIIGGSYRTWGLDVGRAWWERKEWQGSPLKPFFGSEKDNLIMPLIPRITYCDYHYLTLANDHVVTYRCYLDSTWHERTALFTWIMLVFLAFINFCNLFFWILWAVRMGSKQRRQKWVVKKWLNVDDFGPDVHELIEKFAATFKMGNLLLFYYIEAHTDRVVASAFAMELFKMWLSKRQQRGNIFVVNMPKPKFPKSKQTKENFKNPEPNNIGWNTDSQDWDDDVQGVGKTQGFGNSQGFGHAQGFGWNTDSQGWDDPESQQLSSNIYNEPPSSSDTDFSSDNISQQMDTPRRSTSPPSRNGRFYGQNINQGPYAALEPLSTTKLKDKKRTEKKKKDETEDQQGYMCAIM